MNEKKNAPSKEVEATTPESTVDTDDIQQQISETVNFDRLAKSGGDAWLVQLPGSLAGIEYNFVLSKIIHFVSQLTKKTKMETDEDKQKFFSYVVVMTSVGKVLKLPINQGIFDIYYAEHCNEEGTLDADHNPSDMSIKFKVSTILDPKTKKEQLVKGTKYLAKDVSDVAYNPVYEDAIEVEEAVAA
jgi:hypothetical protein